VVIVVNDSDDNYGMGGDAPDSAAIEAQREADMNAAADEMARQSEQESQRQAVEHETRKRRDEQIARANAEREEAEDARVAEEKAEEMQAYNASRKGVKERAGGVVTTDALVSGGKASYFRPQERKEYESRSEAKAKSIAFGNREYDPKYRGASVPINREGRQKYLVFLETQQGELEKKQKRSHAPESRAYKERAKIIGGYGKDIAGAKRGLGLFEARESTRVAPRDVLVSSGLASYFRPGEDAAYLSRLTTTRSEYSGEHARATSISPAGRQQYIDLLKGKKTLADTEYNILLGKVKEKAAAGKPAKPSDTKKLQSLQGKRDLLGSELHLAGNALNVFTQKTIQSGSTPKQKEELYSTFGKTNRFGMSVWEKTDKSGDTLIGASRWEAGYKIPKGERRFNPFALAAPPTAIKSATLEDNEIKSEMDALRTRHPSYGYTKEERKFSLFGNLPKDTGEMPKISGSEALMEFMGGMHELATNPEVAAKAVGKTKVKAPPFKKEPIVYEEKGKQYNQRQYDKLLEERAEKERVRKWNEAHPSPPSKAQLERIAKEERKRSEIAELESFKSAHGGLTPKQHEADTERAGKMVIGWKGMLLKKEKSVRETKEKRHATFKEERSRGIAERKEAKEKELSGKLVNAFKVEAWHNIEREQKRKEDIKEAGQNVKNLKEQWERESIERTAETARKEKYYKERSLPGLFVDVLKPQKKDSEGNVISPWADKPMLPKKDMTLKDALIARSAGYIKSEVKRPFEDLKAGRAARIAGANKHGFLYGGGLQPVRVTPKNPLGEFPSVSGGPKRPPRNPMSMSEMAYFGRPFGVGKALPRNRRGKVSKATRSKARRAQLKARQRGAGGFLGGLGLI
jgi:hypothetical protein